MKNKKKLSFNKKTVMHLSADAEKLPIDEMKDIAGGLPSACYSCLNGECGDDSRDHSGPISRMD